jgi:hypothetical protein
VFIITLHQPIRLIPGVGSKLISIESMNHEELVPSTKLIAIYARVSTARQEEEGTVETQLIPSLIDCDSLTIPKSVLF